MSSVSPAPFLKVSLTARTLYLQPPRLKVSLPLTTRVSVLVAFGCLSGDSSTNSIVLLVPAFSGNSFRRSENGIVASRPVSLSRKTSIRPANRNCFCVTATHRCWRRRSSAGDGPKLALNAWPRQGEPVFRGLRIDAWTGKCNTCRQQNRQCHAEKRALHDAPQSLANTSAGRSWQTFMAMSMVKAVPVLPKLDGRTSLVLKFRR